MQSQASIEIENLRYRYLSSKRLNGADIVYREVLRGIDLRVFPGEKVSVIGPNGAGKSTLLLNIAGLLDEKYRSGSIFISGIELNHRNIYSIREKIGFVFQDPNDQLFSTSVFDDVAFGLLNFLKKKRDSRAKDINYIRHKVSEALSKVNLFGLEDEVPYFLSFGEKKLAALATVLSYDPEILVLDEPSSNLDPKNREDFIKLLKNMDNTIVIATHDLDLAYEFSERTVILNRGNLVFDGCTESVLCNRKFLENNDLRVPLSLKKNL